MQNPVGATVAGGLPIQLPQGLQVTYTDSTHILIQPAPPIQSTVLTVATQIEEAHSTTEHAVNAEIVQQGTTDTNSGEPQKRNIYRHPLFPLMALLFEKCEQATQTSDCPSSDSFDVDIQAFVHHQEQDSKPFFSDDPDLDALMVKAIQVLRIHLLELEKVSELCKDFCNRYISCLKGKLQSENLLRIEGSEDGTQTMLDLGQAQVISSVNGSGLLTPQPAGSSMNQGQIVSGGTVYQMVQTPQGLVAQPIQIQSPPPAAQPMTTTAVNVIHGSTPLSQIGVCTTPLNSQAALSPILMSPASDDEDDYGRGKKNKRGILPKQATQVMKSWLFQHIVHPYPTEDEKRTMSAQTNLSLLQVNNWFINARRRILQPMLDASNPEGSKTKKTKPTQNRQQVQRHWPDSIASMQVSRASSSQTEDDSMTTEVETMEELGEGHTVTSDTQTVLVISEGDQQQLPMQQTLTYLPDSTATTPQMALLAHAQQQGLAAMATMQSQNGGAIDMDDDEDDNNLQNTSSEASETTD